jgi:hypothetical protein
MTVAVPVVDTWDGPNRLIYLKAGVSVFYPIEDIYHEYRNARKTDESLRPFDALIRADGHIPKGGGKFTPRYVTLLLGTKIVPFDDTVEMYQLGEIITDNPDVDPTVFNTSFLTVPKVIYIEPSEAEIIEIQTGGGVGATPQEIWDHVLISNSSADLTLSAAADDASNTRVLVLDQDVVLGNIDDNVVDIHKAHFLKRVWNKLNLLTIFEADKTTPFKQFDTNDDLSDIDPQ